MRTDGKQFKDLAEILGLLSSAQSIIIFPHIQMDGDTLGSAVALCQTLRNQGKSAEILIEDKIPNNIEFLNKDHCVYVANTHRPDLCIAVDCSDLSRLGHRENIFANCKHTISIDHHITGLPFADFNYINPNSSSTGEMIYQLLKELKWDLDVNAGEAIYTAIVTDTGKFMYSNTRGSTHRIVWELFQKGIDHNRVAVEVYQKKRIEKVRLMNSIMSTMKIFANGRASMAHMSEAMLVESGAYPEETEGLVEELRSIDGVEIAVFLKEENGQVKVTMRSKSEGDVSKIAMQFNGGGHKKAAGCMIEGKLADVKTLVVEAINRELNRITV